MHSSRMRTTCSSSHLLGVYASVHARIHPLGVGLEIPRPGVGLQSLLGVGLEIPLGVGLETSLVVGLEIPLARPLNLLFWSGSGDTPCEQNS